MPGAIALADVSVTLKQQRVFNPSGMANESFPDITFGDGSLTYDTYGIPVPSLNALGMLNEIIRICIQQPPTANDGSSLKGYKWFYDPTPRTANPVAPNGTIRAIMGASELSGAVAATTLPLIVIGQ